MIKRILTIIFLFGALATRAQDTTYYDHNWNEIKPPNDVHYFRVTIPNHVDKYKELVNTYYASGQLKSQAHYSTMLEKKLDGKYKEWFESGLLSREMNYFDGKLDGRLLTYWINGMPKRIDTYENGKLINGKCMNIEGLEVPHFEYEKMPQFPGGITSLLQFLTKNIKYPNKLKRKGIEGRVVIGFVIDKNGDVTRIKVIKSVHEDIDNEAIRVISQMPKWLPGLEDGEIKDVHYTIPVSFKLQ